MQIGYKLAPELPINIRSSTKVAAFSLRPSGLIIQLNIARIANAVQQIKENAFAVQ